MTWVAHGFHSRLAFEGSVEADEVFHGLAHIVAIIRVFNKKTSYIH